MAESNLIDASADYEDFTAQFVVRCHILNHEDLGMLEADEVVKDALAPAKMESAGKLRGIH